MRIGALARGMGVPIPTLRRWTQEFADGLSADAQGGDGRPREFSPRDQRVLRRVREILADREVTYVQARQRLRDEGLLAAAPPPPDDVPAPAGPPTAEERDAAERFVATIVTRLSQPLADRIEHLEREVALLRQELAETQIPIGPSDATNAGRRRWPFG
ncbi:MAG: MerR family transcriptional regulator [Chloroflexota bacterium]